jgi:hypothetical protein
MNPRLVSVESRIFCHRTDETLGFQPPNWSSIAAEANQLENITQLEHVKFVMKGGEVIRNDFAK